MSHKTFALELRSLSIAYKERKGILKSCIESAWGNAKIHMAREARQGFNECYFPLTFGGCRGGNADIVAQVSDGVRKLARAEDITISNAGKNCDLVRLYAHW